MKSVHTVGVLLCLLLPGMSACAQALTLNFKSVTLSADQRASLKRYLADSSPDLSFDWNSLQALSHSTGREHRQLSVSLSTVPALTAADVCRSEQHYFYVDGAPVSAHARGRWQANDDLTRFQAWTAQGADCAAASSRIDVGKSVSDAEFLFIARETPTLRSRAAQVIGGSDCARVRFCEVTLRRINRLREESPSRASRVLTRLTFSPLKPGPSCLYVMEVSFVGPLNELVPLGASCPRP